MSRIVLKASAGTGKTYRLSLEFLLSLYRGVPYAEIFIMTFTRKATAEIRERILEFAKEILDHSPKGEEILQNLQSLAPGFILEEEKLKTAYFAMMKNKEKIRIYTIDSFFQMIFHKIVCPYHQAYTMNLIEKEEEIKECYQKILKKIFLQAELFSEMQEFFALAPEKDIEHYVSLIRYILQERWKFLLLKKREKRKLLEPRKSWSEYSETFESIFRQIESIRKKEKNYFITEFFADFFQGSEEKREEMLQNQRDDFFDKKLFNGVRLRKDAKEEEVRTLREQLLEEFSFFQEDVAKTIYPEMIDYEEKLFSILERIYSLYDEYKWQEKGFTYEDVTIYTYLTLFEEDLQFVQEGKVSDLLEESLDLKIHSIFLDEFQDTSILQWKVLSVFLEKAEEVICVGDEKQSIYGWRGGEKTLFEKLDGILSAKVERLDTSYRSLASVIDFTNAVFTEYPKQYAEEGTVWDFAPSKSHKKEYGEVSLNFLGEEESQQQLLDLIRKKYKNHYGSLGILARKNKTLLQLADLFEKEKIPYRIFAQEEHYEEEVIASFLSLFRYFITDQYLYLLEFFRSPLLHCSNRVLKKLLLRKENVVQYIQGFPCEEEIPKECEQIRLLYLEFQKTEGRIENTWLQSLQIFSALQYFTKDKNRLAWYRFQEVLSFYETWEEYFQDLDQNRVQVSNDWEEENQDSIQLMTIHKSKGLEFDNVIYYDVKSSGKGRNTKNLYFYCHFDEKYQEVRDAFLTSSRYRKYLEYLPEPFCDYIQQEKKQNIEEEMNTFYVALTRPKHNLHLFLSEKFQGRKCLENLNYTVGEHYQEELSAPLTKKVEEGIVFPFWKEEKKYMADEKQRPQKYTEETEWKRMEGIVTHFFLEHLEYATEEELHFARQRTFQEYTNYFGLERMEALFSEKRMEEILQKEPLIFSKSWDKIYNEYPILEKETQRKYILDRLMIQYPKGKEKGKILIVDYKTGGSNPKQLEKYAKLVKKSLEEESEKYEIQTKFLNLGREGE